MTSSCPTCGRRPSERHARNPGPRDFTCPDLIHDLADEAPERIDSLNDMLADYAEKLVKLEAEVGKLQAGVEVGTKGIDLAVVMRDEAPHKQVAALTISLNQIENERDAACAELKNTVELLRDMVHKTDSVKAVGRNITSDWKPLAQRARMIVDRHPLPHPR